MLFVLLQLEINGSLLKAKDSIFTQSHKATKGDVIIGFLCGPVTPCKTRLFMILSFIFSHHRGHDPGDLELTLRLDGLVFGVCGHEGDIVAAFP